MSAPAPLAVGIAGLGNVGSEVARWLSTDAPCGLLLAAVAGRDETCVRARLVALGIVANGEGGTGANVPPGVEARALDALAARCDVLVDCLTPDASAAWLDGCIESGRTIVTLNAGVLLLDPRLLDRARRAGTRLLVPSGAVAGVDALRAAAMGTVHSVRIRTSKPPAGLVPDSGEGPRLLFDGNALEAVRRWPRNVNVAATLSLAGIGGERTKVEIRSDPALERNVHEIEIDSDSTLLRIRIENRPSAGNPRSSAIAAYSVRAALKGLVDPVRFAA